MKKNLGMYILASRCGVGAVFLALCAFTPASRADVTVINNSGDTSDGGSVVAADGGGGTAWAQTFLSGSSGQISSLTLTLAASSGSMEVDLYAVADSGSGPSGTAVDIGSVAAGTGIVTLNNVNVSANPLTSGDYYAIALQPAGSGSDSISWNATATSASGGSGTLYEIYKNTGSGWVYSSSTPYLQMDLSVTPVPEVPLTGVVMGFGALAIAVGSSLRRKMRPAVSSIA